jgi:hypothetical protein
VSVEAITWALGADAPSSTSKFVLVALANCARAEDGRAWPSVAYLCDATQQDRKTVIANIGRLESAGLIREVGRMGSTKQIRMFELGEAQTNGAENGTVPKFPSKGTVFPRKESQISPERVPKTGHGTVRNHKGTVIEPKKPSASVGADGANGGAEPIPECPHQVLLKLFADRVPSLPVPMPELWDGTKAKNLRARWRWVMTAKRSSGKKAGQRYATSEAEAIDFFGRFFGYVEASDFLTGRDDRNWQGCSLDWLVKQSNFSKVVQGNYENKVAPA